jgi:hypothetical protein
MFLGFGKDTSKEALIERDRKEYDTRRKRYLAEYERRKAESAKEATPRKSVRDRVSSVIHKVKVKSESRKLKQFRKHRDAQERKAANSARVKSDSEKAAFGKELDVRERAEYEDYRAERKEIKARRRAKLKEGLSKVSSGFNFDEGSGGFDLHLTDDHREYKPKGKAYSDGLDAFVITAPKSSRSKPSNLDSMFAIGSGKGADLSMFAIGSNSRVKGKRTKQLDLAAMFSLSPAKGRRRKKDPLAWF